MSDSKEEKVGVIVVCWCVGIFQATLLYFAIIPPEVLQRASLATLESLRWTIIFVGQHSVSGVIANTKVHVCAVLVVSSDFPRD
jgi:hypothetical protein